MRPSLRFVAADSRKTSRLKPAGMHFGAADHRLKLVAMECGGFAQPKKCGCQNPRVPGDYSTRTVSSRSNSATWSNQSFSGGT